MSLLLWTKNLFHWKKGRGCWDDFLLEFMAIEGVRHQSGSLHADNSFLRAIPLVIVMTVLLFVSNFYLFFQQHSEHNDINIFLAANVSLHSILLKIKDCPLFILIYFLHKGHHRQIFCTLICSWKYWLYTICLTNMLLFFTWIFVMLMGVLGVTYEK